MLLQGSLSIEQMCHLAGSAELDSIVTCEEAGLRKRSGVRGSSLDVYQSRSQEQYKKRP